MNMEHETVSGNLNCIVCGKRIDKEHGKLNRSVIRAGIGGYIEFHCEATNEVVAIPFGDDELDDFEDILKFGRVVRRKQTLDE